MWHLKHKLKNHDIIWQKKYPERYLNYSSRESKKTLQDNFVFHCWFQNPKACFVSKRKISSSLQYDFMYLNFKLIKSYWCYIIQVLPYYWNKISTLFSKIQYMYNLCSDIFGIYSGDNIYPRIFLYFVFIELQLQKIFRPLFTWYWEMNPWFILGLVRPTTY